jgi:hypothetical protein
MNPFDIVKDLSNEKKGIINEENEKEYLHYIVNKAFSYYVDTALLANEMNMNPHLDKRQQYDFYFNAVRPRKRYSKWHKREVTPELQAIADFFRCSIPKAKVASSILTSVEKEEILKLFESKNEKD